MTTAFEDIVAGIDEVPFRATPVRIVGRVCTYPEPVDQGRGVAGPCKRPVWGDGRVSGNGYHWCSRCWHMHQLIHGGVAVMRANPASHTLNAEAIDKLTFKDQSLPPTTADQIDDTFPEEWT